MNTHRLLAALAPTLLLAALAGPPAARADAAASDGAAPQPATSEAGTADTTPGHAVVMANGNVVPAKSAPLIALGHVVYDDLDGVRHALRASLVDVEATQARTEALEGRETDAAVAHARRAADAVVSGDAARRHGSSAATIPPDNRREMPSDREATAADGSTVRLSDLRGKVVLVDFWATWCGPCVREMPHVKAAREALSPDDFAVFGVSLDRSREHLDVFAEKHGLDWPQAFDGKAWGSPNAKKWRVRAIPRAFLLDRQGRIADEAVRGAEITATALALIEEGRERTGNDAAR